MIVGKKSKDEPGIIFAPYIAMQSSPTIINSYSLPQERMIKIADIFDFEPEVSEDRFSPKKLISSRYAKKMVNSRFYGTIEIKRDTI